jgi:hypothetical protein
LAVVIGYLLAGIILLIGLIIAAQTGSYWRTGLWTVACALIAAQVAHLAIMVVGWIIAGFADINDATTAEPMDWAIMWQAALGLAVFSIVPVAILFMVPLVAGYPGDRFSGWWPAWWGRSTITRRHQHIWSGLSKGLRGSPPSSPSWFWGLCLLGCWNWACTCSGGPRRGSKDSRAISLASQTRPPGGRRIRMTDRDGPVGIIEEKLGDLAPYRSALLADAILVWMQSQGSAASKCADEAQPLNMHIQVFDSARHCPRDH